MWKLKIKSSMFFIAGHQQVRRVWKDYYEAVDVVVFMVDAADVGRLGMSNFYSFLHSVSIRYSKRFLIDFLMRIYHNFDYILEPYFECFSSHV